MAWTRASMVSGFRPSLKLGTHSTRRSMIGPTLASAWKLCQGGYTARVDGIGLSVIAFAVQLRSFFRFLPGTDARRDPDRQERSRDEAHGCRNLCGVPQARRG